MAENRTVIHLELVDDEKVQTEVEGKLFDLINLLLNGIDNMFDDLDRLAFKSGIKSLYKKWEEEEAKSDE